MRAESGGLTRPERAKGLKAAVTVALILLVLLLGCDEERAVEGQDEVGGDVAAGEPVPAFDPEVIVTGDDPALPEGCHPRQVAELVIDFVDAFNRGDTEALSRVFFLSDGPSPPDYSQQDFYPWSWYLVSEVDADGTVQNGFVTYDQAELMSYFEERHRQGERLRLLKVSLTQTGLLGEEDNVGFVYVLTRDAEDLDPALGGPSRIAWGEAAVNCGNRRIYAWRMDMRAEDERSERDAADWLCTDPPRWRPGEQVVACT